MNWQLLGKICKEGAEHYELFKEGREIAAEASSAEHQIGNMQKEIGEVRQALDQAKGQLKVLTDQVSDKEAAHSKISVQVTAAEKRLASANAGVDAAKARQDREVAEHTKALADAKERLEDFDGRLKAAHAEYERVSIEVARILKLRDELRAQFSK